MTPRTVRTLMSGLIDYAGLYPPAKLSMQQSVHNYSAYRAGGVVGKGADNGGGAGGGGWMLGRFICPVSRLEEFRHEARDLAPGEGGLSRAAHFDWAIPDDPRLMPWDKPWHLSAILDGEGDAGFEENLDAVFAFNHEHRQPSAGLAVIDSVELKIHTAEELEKKLDAIPEEITPYFEIPLGHGSGGDSAKLLERCASIIAEANVDLEDGILGPALKIRTGGITPEAFPPTEAIASFLTTLVRIGYRAGSTVPFKATAGLHHPLRGPHPLTYEPGCASATMHGFLNVFLAATFALTDPAGKNSSVVLELLNEKDGRSLVADDSSLSIGAQRLGHGSIARCREVFARGFGSCSFEEPALDLRKLGLLKD